MKRVPLLVFRVRLVVWGALLAFAAAVGSCSTDQPAPGAVANAGQSAMPTSSAGAGALAGAGTGGISAGGTAAPVAGATAAAGTSASGAGAAGQGGLAGNSAAGGATNNSGTSGQGGQGGLAGGSGGTPGGGGSGGTPGGGGSGGTPGGGGSGGNLGGGNGGGGDSAGGAAAGMPASGAGGMGGMAGAGGSGGEAAAYNPCPSSEACRVLPYGDSITDGFNIPGGYRIELFHLTLQAGQNLTFVGTQTNGPTMVDGQPFPRNHEGYSGYRIDEIAAPGVFNGAMAQNPNIVLLKIGTNDMLQNFNVNTAPERLADLIDAIADANPDALIVVALMIPTQDQAANQRIQTYNAAIPALIEERAAAGLHILLVDMYAPFVAEPNYLSTLIADGIHPNETGYALMASVWYEAISEFLP